MPWASQWARRGLNAVCEVCQILQPAACVVLRPSRRGRIAGDQQGAEAKRAENCRRCAASDPLVKPLERPPNVLCDLRYAERMLLARVQFNQLLIDLPKSRIQGQFGRLYAVPLAVPQVVDLFEKAEFVDVDGCLSMTWPDQPIENALALRARPMLEALSWLHEHNGHYKDQRVTDCVVKWRRRLSQVEGICTRKTRPASAAEEDACAWQSDVTQFTSGGPAPAGADIVQLEQLRGLARLETRVDEKMFPMLFPCGEGSPTKPSSS